MRANVLYPTRPCQRCGQLVENNRPVRITTLAKEVVLCGPCTALAMFAPAEFRAGGWQDRLRRSGN